MILTVTGSAVGWTAETLLFLYLRRRFVDRGLLILPLCPVYGLGMLALYSIMRTPQSGFWQMWQSGRRTKAGRILVGALSIVFYAALAAVFATLTELITGVVFHKAFGIRLWSYHGHENNFGGYVCLGYSLLWGVLAALYMGLVWYNAMQLLARANVAALAPIAFVLVALTAADFCFNIFYLHIRGMRYLPFG